MSLRDYCDRWGALLTEAKSLALVEEIEQWCERTGTNYNKLVVAAGVRPSIRHMIRVKGKRVTPNVAARLRRAMRDYPEGISREEYRGKPKPWGGATESAPPPKPEHEIANSATCARCGAREGQCEHTRILSAKVLWR